MISRLYHTKIHPPYFHSNPIYYLQAVKKIASRYSGCGIRSASFQENILTVGTGLGMLMFYDVRAGKYMESSINSSRTVVLKASRGYVVSGQRSSLAFSLEEKRIYTGFKANNLLHWNVFTWFCSSQRKTLMDSSRSNMYQLYTHTAMTAVELGFLQLVARYPRRW